MKLFSFSINYDTTRLKHGYLFAENEDDARVMLETELIHLTPELEVRELIEQPIAERVIAWDWLIRGTDEIETQRIN